MADAPRARWLAPLAVAAAIVAVAWIVRDRGDGSHTLRASFASALQIRPGQDVRIAGRRAGSIRSARLVDGRAVVTLAVDDAHWPLHRGTVARLRYGAPLGYALRYVDLRPGPASAPPLPDEGVLAGPETITPVEFDDLPRIFGPRTRRDLSRLLARAGTALDATDPDIAATVDAGGPAAGAIAAGTAELAADPHALRVLVASTASAAEQTARNDERLAPLVADAATTLETIARRSREVGELLAEAPGTLGDGRRVLAHVDRTSARLERLARAFAPGARRLRAIAPVAGRVTVSLAESAPRLATLLRAGTRALPRLTDFMERGRRDLPVAGRALAGLTDPVRCLRPYAPELAGYLSTTASAHAAYDADGHYIRLGLTTPPTPVPSTLSPQQAIELVPRLRYSMVRPPGLNAGQPWYQPECGVTPLGSDPLRDQEAAP